MERRRRFGRIGTCLAAGVLGIGAVAQLQPPAPTPAGPGGFPGFGPSAFIPPTQDQIKKQTTNRVLREMVALKLTAKDLTAAQPLLKDLLDAENAYHAQTDAALDQERSALLAAGPEDAAVPDSAAKTQQAMQVYQDKQNKTWDALTRAIGEGKANGLRSLAGQGGFSPMGFPVGPAGGQGRGPAGTPAGPGGLQLRPEGPDGRPTPVPGGSTVPLPQRNGPAGGQAMMPGMPFFMRPHVTLAEMVDLVEQKLVAMKK